MPDAAPYVEAVPEVPVWVTIGGEARPGYALGWRGDRVFVRYRGPLHGNHLSWVSKDDVERGCEDPAEALASPA